MNRSSKNSYKWNGLYIDIRRFYLERKVKWERGFIFIRYYIISVL